MRGPGREGRADIGQRVSPSRPTGLWGQLLSRRTVLCCPVRQRARLLSKGNLLEAAARGEIAGVSKLHAEYLKEMSEYGVPSRRSDLPVRVEAHNHGSVHG